MSILITGAAGIVANDLINKLSQKQKIIAVFRKKKKQKYRKNVKLINHNLKYELTKKIYPKPKYIIHCAVDQRYLHEKNFLKYIEANLSILKNIILFSKKNKIKLIIFLSSVEVYGDIEKKMIDESYKPKNPNIYGFTKLLLETVLSYYQINFVNLRLPGILFEPTKKKRNRPWMNNVFEKFIKNKTILVHNLKGKFNNIVTTNEIVRFIKFIIKKKIIVRDSFNFACSKPILIKNLLLKSKKKLNSNSKINEIENFNKSSFCISSKKIEEKLNYKVKSTNKVLEEYLKAFIKVKT